MTPLWPGRPEAHLCKGHPANVPTVGIEPDSTTWPTRPFGSAVGPNCLQSEGTLLSTNGMMPICSALESLICHGMSKKLAHVAKIGPGGPQTPPEQHEPNCKVPQHRPKVPRKPPSFRKTYADGETRLNDSRPPLVSAHSGATTPVLRELGFCSRCR